VCEDDVRGVERKYEKFISSIASLSGEDEAIVMKVYEGVSVLMNRMHEILKETIRLKGARPK
jgi:hypothetical protein